MFLGGLTRLSGLRGIDLYCSAAGDVAYSIRAIGHLEQCRGGSVNIQIALAYACRLKYSAAKLDINKRRAPCTDPAREY